MTTKPHDRLLFIGGPDDLKYVPFLKSCLGGVSCAAIFKTPSTFFEIKQVCAAKNATAVISNSSALLAKLVENQSAGSLSKKPSINNYAGSLFKVPGTGIEVVFIDPLEQLFTIPYMKFMTTRYITKLTRPQNWYPVTQFNWRMFDEASFQGVHARFAEAVAIAIDIETFSHPPSIRCVGYTALFYSKAAGWSTESCVIPCDSLYALACIRQLNNLPVPKAFQNGKYDISYLQAYNAAPVNYLWDTAECFHSWYSELPKDLAYLNTFFVRESMYWKDLADTRDLKQYYMYCALDTWATINVLIAWFAEAPDWAMNNYANTFPLQFPCHLSEMTGIKKDFEEQDIVRAEIVPRIAEKRARLEILTDTPNFNPNSPVQVMQLLRVLGCADIKSTNEKDISKAILRHPVNEKILNLILEVRGDRKLISTYLRTDADVTKTSKKGAKEFYGHIAATDPLRRNRTNGRILYTLNPHGTDSGRLASKEHHFWCGLQIQNIPRGTDVKRTLIADNGYFIAEADLEQAESRDTAYIAGDECLIRATTGDRDFHSVNASAFFGVPYDSIYDDSTKRTKNKALRDLAKRVNHGAVYNMGPGVLIDTMGIDKIREAQRLLKLPSFWTLIQVAEHLLSTFHSTYISIEQVYYKNVTAEVMTTSMISSKAVHDVAYQANKQGLVRYCFGNPTKNKRDLNSYVAHPPQSLNAMTLNRAYMKVFYEIAMHPNHRGDFKLLAQIHDSILFQYRINRPDLPLLVKACMEIPVTIQGYDGKDRTFTVPAAVKAGKNSSGVRRWSLTE